MKQRDNGGFTLIEMLTAIAVLSLMMVFMFNIAGQTVRAWETGSRRMESAQTARIGMNLLASELRYAFAGAATNTGTDGKSVFQNFAPFVVTNNLPGESADFTPVPGSQSLFFVSSCAPHDAQECVPFAEIGYMPVFVSVPGGRNNMIDSRYYLVRHGASPGVMTNTSYQDFYYRQPPDGKWTMNAATTGSRTPLVDNCIRFSLQFASNSSGTIKWTTNWASATNLPLGVVVTMLVLDNKSAARLAAINKTTVLDAQTIDKATNDVSLPPTDVSGRILREGTTVIRRFIPLVNSYYAQ